MMLNASLMIFFIISYLFGKYSKLENPISIYNNKFATMKFIKKCENN